MLSAGRVMAQAVNRWPLAAEAWIRDRVSPCWICSGQSDTEAASSTSSSVFSCQYYSTAAPYSYITWGMKIVSLRAAVWSKSLVPSS
jgi:hypothetical protein